MTKKLRRTYKRRFIEDDMIARYKEGDYEEEYHTKMHKHLLTDDNYFNARAEMALEDYFKQVHGFDLENSWVLEFGCFTKNCNVTLEDFTEKKISEINKNDKIRTHKGCVKEVNKTFVRNTKHIIELEVRGNLKISTTEEHPFFAIKKEDFKCCNVLLRFGQKCKFCNKQLNPKPKFILAKDLKIGDYLINPIPKLPNKLKYINTKKYLSQYKIRKCKTTIPSKIKITKNLMWLFGLWLAKGSYNKAHGKINGIKLSLNINRKDLVTKVSKILKVFGNIQINVRKDKNINEIILCNKKLSCLFFELFNEHSKDKKIHKDLFNTSPSLLLELFKGFYEGDGNFIKNKHQCYIRLTSISKKLLNQLYWIAIINKLPINKNKDRLILNGDCSKIKNNIKPNHINRYTHSFIYKEWVMRPIFKKKIKNKKVKVYNLNVDSPHSYLVNNIAVHNCGLGQNIAKIPNAVGFDVSNFALRMAQDRGVKVINKLGGSNDVYDFVFCRHVLEHLENPFEFLKLMRECLVNTGQLILILPMEWHEKVKIEKTDNQHLYSWNFRCINNLLYKAGYTPISNKIIKRAGFKKLLPLRKISLGTYKFATHLAALINGNKEMMIVAMKK